MAVKKAPKPVVKKVADVTDAAAARDAAIEAFCERDAATQDEAFDFADALEQDGMVKDFKRRNGCHPALDGYPLVALSNGELRCLNPAHDSNYENGRAAIQRGLMNLKPSNGA